MKTIKIFTCMLAMVLLTLACSKDLDTTSTRQLATTYYDYDDHMLNAVNGAYAPLELETGAWGSNPWLWGSCAASDDAWAAGGGSTDRIGYQLSNTHAIVASEPDLFNLWQSYFYGIDRCNLILTYVKPESDIKKNAIGQAEFLCGYYYFYLSRVFGGLPLMSKVPKPTEIVPRSTIQETYTYIENILNKAINSGMQERTNGSDPDNGLATKASAQALLGKVFMYHAFYDKTYYDSAVTYLQEVANNPNYALEVEFWKVFSPSNIHGPESIFEVNFTQSTTNGPQGNPLATLCGPRTVANQVIDDTINFGWGFNQPTQELKNFFISNNDYVRLNATIFDTATLQAWHNAWKHKFDLLVWQNSKEGYFDRKHYSNIKLSSAWNGNRNPMIVLRLADIYLLLAEALVQSGKTQDSYGNNATHYVNLVRERVHLADLSNVSMADIKNERHLELALEGERWFDLIRWGDASSAILAKPAAGILSYDEGLPGKNSNGFWPIPDVDISRGNGIVLQNPGY